MSHAPKLRALEAHAEARLSPRASARLARHLAHCDVCRGALARVRAYAQLRGEARAQSSEDARAEVEPVSARAPEGALRPARWERLEALLDAAPKVQARAPKKVSPERSMGKWIALGWPVLAVAAALFIAWLGRLQPGVPPPAPVAQQSVPSPVAPRMIVGWVSLLAGQATLAQGASVSAIALDTRVHEGDVLSTAADARLHVQLGATTGFALAPNTRLRVATLRAGEVALELLAGRVANQVAKLERSEQYRVLADDLSASVRGTRFWVERSGEIAVFVHEGRVEVARGGELLASLTPGQGYPQQRFASAQREPASPVHIAPPDVAATVGLVLPPLPALRAFLIDGAALPVAGTLAMRLPRGASELRFEDPRGQIRTVHVDSTAPLTTLEPAALTALLTPKPGPVGYLSPEQISSVVRTAIDPLRRCYEHSLRFTPALESKLSLRIRVSAEGRVLRSEVEAREKLPIALQRCIELEAQKLIFPKPEGAGPLSFEVPLNLRSR